MIAAFFGLVIIVLLSVVTFWHMNPALFLITAGVSLMVGLFSPRQMGDLNSIHLTQGICLMVIAYAFCCIGFAYVRMFQRE